MADSTKICEQLIAADINTSCEANSKRGLQSDGTIVNYNDIDFAKTKFSTTNKNIITDLILKTGKKGYNVHQAGQTPFNGTQKAFKAGTNVNTWDKTVKLVVLDEGPEVTRDIIDPLANGKFVAILKNNSKGVEGSAEYEIFGYDQGLFMTEGTNDKWNEDTAGGYDVTLVEASAPTSGRFLFDTDKETTDAKYESLKTATA